MHFYTAIGCNFTCTTNILPIQWPDKQQWCQYHSVNGFFWWRDLCFAGTWLFLDTLTVTNTGIIFVRADTVIQWLVVTHTAASSSTFPCISQQLRILFSASFLCQHNIHMVNTNQTLTVRRVHSMGCRLYVVYIHLMTRQWHPLHSKHIPCTL